MRAAEEFAADPGPPGAERHHRRAEERQAAAGRKRPGPGWECACVADHPSRMARLRCSVQPAASGGTVPPGGAEQARAAPRRRRLLRGLRDTGPGLDARPVEEGQRVGGLDSS